MKSFKNKSLQEKGITLIALIITVIILLILAGVSIMAINNTSLFDKTRKAAELYKQRATEENEILEGYGRTLNEYLEGRTVATNPEDDTPTPVADVPFNNGTLNKTSTKVGKTINYTTQVLSDSTFTLPTYPGIVYWPDGTNAMSESNAGRTENLTWKVLSEDTNGNLLITTTTPTTAKIILGDTEQDKGANGYNNAVQALDAYCYKYFSNETAGLEARNIKLEDIEAHETSAGTTARENYNYVTSNGTKTYYPGIYPLESQGIIGLSDSPTSTKYAPWTGDAFKEDGATVYSSGYNNTYYSFSNDDVLNSNYYDSSTVDLLFTENGRGNGYFISTRSTSDFRGGCCFAIRRVEWSGGLDNAATFYSYISSGRGWGRAFKPVVSIPASKVANFTLS